MSHTIIYLRILVVDTNTYIFHNGGPYRLENSPLICYYGFYMIGTSFMKELNQIKKTL